VTTPYIQGVTPNSDKPRNLRVIIASEGENKGLQNLYSGVRFPPAPPTSCSSETHVNTSGSLNSMRCSSRTRATLELLGQNGEHRTKRGKHLGQVASDKTRTSEVCL
jgi:hypothetical protein